MASCNPLPYLYLRSSNFSPLFFFYSISCLYRLASPKWLLPLISPQCCVYSCVMLHSGVPFVVPQLPKPSALFLHSHNPRPQLPNRSVSKLLVNNNLNNEMEVGGVDSEGREFKNAEEMWREEVGVADPSKKSDWYRQGVGYWQGVEATVDGVLGGYGAVNEPDTKGSEEFLNSLLAERFLDAGRSGRLVALDCGSGIGRVTKNLLIRYFNEVDLLEPASHFLDAAQTNLAPENLMVTAEHKAVKFYCVPLQEFTPDCQRYDVIWVQWCIGHLSDEDFISFFKRAKDGLKPGGFFVLKENLARHGFVLDKQDKSVTRSDLYFKQLFNQCGLNIYKMKDQKGFPNELFAVKMYALAPQLPKRVNKSKSNRQVNRPGIIR